MKNSFTKKYHKDIFLEYKKRISRFISIDEIIIKKGELNIKQQNEISNKNTFIIRVINDGYNLNTLEFKDIIQNCINDRLINEIIFIFDDLKLTSNIDISFSQLINNTDTLLIMVIEQIYRAFSIINQMPYHK